MFYFYPKAALLACLCFLPLTAFAEDAPQRVEQGNLVTLSVPAISDGVHQGLKSFENVRSARFVDWAPDGKGMLVTTRFAEVDQVHHVATPLGARRQLGFFDEPVRSAKTAPGKVHHGFAFLKDEGGNENYQIYFHDFKSGESRLLTDGYSRNQSMVWNSAGTRIAYMSNKRTGRSWDVYVADPANPDDVLMVVRGEDYYWIPVAFSPDDTKLLMANYVSINHSTLAVVDLKDGSTRYVMDARGPAYYGNGVFSKDGHGLYFTSDLEGEFRTLRHLDLRTNIVRELTAHIPWDVTDIALSEDGKTLAFISNEGGFSKLWTMSTAKEKMKAVKGQPKAVLSNIAFSPDGKSLAMTVNSPISSGDAYALDMNTGHFVRWTHSETGGLDSARLSDMDVIDYPSFDQRRIPALIMRPKGKKGPHPVIIRIHGGPEGQAVPTFSSTYQYWANELGFAVIQPNVRGSSGYGKSYLLLDNGFLREDSVKDIGALLDWIRTQPDLDADRVVVYGGSYGGYMVLASMVHYADRLLGGIDVVGISNFVTFLENTQAYRRDLRRVEYGDERDPAMRAHLEAISPLNHVEKMTKPLFVIQGLNDPRVPVTESEQMVKELQDRGGKVWYMMAKDEGHGFRKKSNRDAMNEAMAMFLTSLLEDRP